MALCEKCGCDDFLGGYNGAHPTCRECGTPVPSYVLVDVNPYYNNCGHYPEWEVFEFCEAREKGLGFDRPDGVQSWDYEAMEAEASKRNKRSKDRWRAFLDA